MKRGLKGQHEFHSVRTCRQTAFTRRDPGQNEQFRPAREETGNDQLLTFNFSSNSFNACRRDSL